MHIKQLPNQPNATLYTAKPRGVTEYSIADLNYELGWQYKPESKERY